jgi:protein subunit release factor A
MEFVMKLTLEIHPAEGGDDAKMLVHDQAAIYTRFAARNGLKAHVEARGYL